MNTMDQFIMYVSTKLLFYDTFQDWDIGVLP